MIFDLIDALRLLETNNPVFLFLYLFFIGASVGSFLSFLSYRYSEYVDSEDNKLLAEINNEKHIEIEHSSIFSARSSCDNCYKKIPLYHNVPILSWLILRGKSACCRKPIPAKYFLAELWLAIIFSSGILAFGVGVEYFAFIFIATSTFLIADIDQRTRILPFPLTCVIGLGYGYFLSIFSSYEITSFLAYLFIGFCVSQIISISNLSNKLIGDGDLHFFALACAIFSSDLLNTVIFFFLFAVSFVIFNLNNLRGENPCGFSLHFSVLAVLLVHIN